LDHNPVTHIHSNQPGTRSVAIACQGGGSHTAFTAGLLTGVLPHLSRRGYRVIALSGSSGGAICALLAWGALVQHGRGNNLSSELQSLRDFWRASAARTPWERAWNDWVIALRCLQLNGTVPELRTSPYAPTTEAFEDLLTRTAPRPEFFDLRRLLEDHAPEHLLGQTIVEPRLLVSAVDVLSGRFKLFDSSVGEITVNALLASCALPSLYQAQRVNGAIYWDGLFSQNPPVHDLVSVPKGQVKPDEIWLVRINPRERNHEPRSASEIEDRRNELGASISLHQELRFIDRVNQWLKDGTLRSAEHKPITVRELEMDHEISAGLGYSSKLNRSPRLLDRLFEHGIDRAHRFVERLPSVIPAEESGQPALRHS